ncbi:MAG TPA: TonB-dependent receptor [Candidatus Acidoferrales bacterium]|nr:TonB-dependent receptor [Candidatus Acidoferrales bacterium]
MRLHRLPAVAGLLLAFSCVASSRAQTASTITGSLSDPSGSAVVGARIVAQRIDSKENPRETRSGDEGKFSLTIAPGRYRLSIDHESFARVEEVVSLAPGETRKIDFHLELRRLAATVVVTAAAEPELASAAPARVDIITRQQIEQRGDVFLTPLLASVPGASFSQLGPMGGTTTFFLDGGNSNYTKVFVDGAPVNQPGGLVDFSNFTLDDVDKIEVVHGAASALYGSDAMGGVIQIFTHRGTTRIPEIVLQGDGGTFGTGHSSAQISGLLGAFDYSVDAAYLSSQGQGPGNFFRDTTLSGNFGWKFSDTSHLRLALQNNSSDAGQPGQTLLPGEAVVGQSTGIHDFSSDLRWDFPTGPHWQDQVSGFESRFRSVDYSPLFGTFVSEFNRAGLNAQSSYLFHGGSATAGYHYEVENGPTEGRHNQAGYLEIRYQFGSRLTAIAGGRVEDNGFFGTRAVPRVGAAFTAHRGNAFWGATRLRSSFGLGIKEPEMLPAGCSPQLDPERSTTFDAGVDQDFASGRARVSVTYFHNDFHDIVSFAGATSNPNCPAYFGSFFNTDAARAYGANSQVEMEITAWLRIVGNYTYDDSKILRSPNATDPALVPGSRLFKRPLHSASLIANAHFRRMNWNLAGYYVGRRADSDFDSFTVNGVCTGFCISSDPSYVRWDLANSIDLGHGFSTLAVVNNLFNRHYQDAVGYPALRLNYRLGVKYTWGRE